MLASLSPLLIVWVGIVLVLLFFMWRESRYPSVRHYPFRVDLQLSDEPVVRQVVYLMVPARSVDQAQHLAEQIGLQHDTIPTFVPEFRG